MAPRGRKKSGMMREDAARDAMRNYGFDERVIKESIKELLEVYGDDHWLMIEEDRYGGLLNICLEKQGQQEEKAEEQEQEEETTHVGSNSTSLVGCGMETGTQVCQTDAYSTSTAVMDSSPGDFLRNDASADYAHQPVGGATNSRCGWLSSEEESDPEEDVDGNDDDDDDDDDEMIQLTPEPLCEELQELLREVRGQKKRKRATRWDT